MLQKYTFPRKQVNKKYTFLIKLWYKDYGMWECGGFFYVLVNGGGMGKVPRQCLVECVNV